MSVIRRYRVVRRRATSGRIRYAVRAEPLGDVKACWHDWILLPNRWASASGAQDWIDLVQRAQLALLTADRPAPMHLRPMPAESRAS